MNFRLSLEPTARGPKFFLALLGGVLLSAAYLHPWLFALGWIAFVPLLLAMSRSTVMESYFLGLAFGFTSYASSAYWVVDFFHLSKGHSIINSYLAAIMFWLYCAQLPGSIAFLFSGLRRATPLHETLLFPVIVAVVYAIFPMLFPVQLGESQSHYLAALQATAFTGVYGLDFTMALVNSMVAAWLSQRFAVKNRSITVGTSLFIALWFGYGFYATYAWELKFSQWQSKKIGIVESNEQPSIPVPQPTPGFSRAYPPEMAITEILAAAGAELVIWPETRFKGYFQQPHVQQAFHQQVAEMGTALILQDVEHQGRGRNLEEFNSAAAINAQGEAAGVYRKIQRVPFSEYNPLDSLALPSLPKMSFSTFIAKLSAGDKPKRFDLANMSVVPLICYEAMFPRFVARALSTNDPASDYPANNYPAEHTRGRILVVQSNDAWFGRTRQPYQHLYSSALRAVENGVPLIHVINNGPSGIVMPNGRFLFHSTAATHASGHMVLMPYSSNSGGSFFSRNPALFLNTMCMILLGLIIIAVPYRKLFLPLKSPRGKA